MDMLSPTTHSQPTQDKHWPHAPAVRGQTYGVEDPIHAGDKLVVMTNNTWLDYGTAFETMRRQTMEIKAAAEKLKVAYDIAVRELVELRTKHQNLRDAVKRQRRTAMRLVSPKS